MQIKSNDKGKEITREDFDRLLKLLDPDPERAAVLYEKLRYDMITIFSKRMVPCSEDLADEAFNRTMRRLRSIEPSDIHNATAYLKTVAKKLCWEYIAGQNRVVSLDDGYLEEEHFKNQVRELDLDDGVFEALEGALNNLPIESRKFILTYHQVEKQGKKESREAMAKEYGLTVNALRLRAHRIRAKLKEDIDMILFGPRSSSE
jgi:RNA polymerase sigma factor (sigma-70 family)